MACTATTSTRINAANIAANAPIPDEEGTIEKMREISYYWLHHEEYLAELSKYIPKTQSCDPADEVTQYLGVFRDRELRHLTSKVLNCIHRIWEPVHSRLEQMIRREYALDRAAGWGVPPELELDKRITALKKGSAAFKLYLDENIPLWFSHLSSYSIYICTTSGLGSNGISSFRLWKIDPIKPLSEPPQQLSLKLSFLQNMQILFDQWNALVESVITNSQGSSRNPNQEPLFFIQKRPIDLVVTWVFYQTRPAFRPNRLGKLFDSKLTVRQRIKPLLENGTSAIFPLMEGGFSKFLAMGKKEASHHALVHDQFITVQELLQYCCTRFPHLFDQLEAELPAIGEKLLIYFTQSENGQTPAPSVTALGLVSEFWAFVKKFGTFLRAACSTPLPRTIRDENGKMLTLDVFAVDMILQELEFGVRLLSYAAGKSDAARPGTAVDPSSKMKEIDSALLVTFGSFLNDSMENSYDLVNKPIESIIASRLKSLKELSDYSKRASNVEWMKDIKKRWAKEIRDGLVPITIIRNYKQALLYTLLNGFKKERAGRFGIIYSSPFHETFMKEFLLPTMDTVGNNIKKWFTEGIQQVRGQEKK